MNINIYIEFERLVNYGLRHNLFEEEDKTYIRNSLIELFKLDEYIFEEVDDENLENVTPILNNILDYAFENGILESNSSVYRDLLDTKIMSLLMPRPSQVIKEFKCKYKDDKKSATDYFYNLSKACDYVRTDRIAQNMTWKTSTEYGDIDITINLSKPEKDPKAIAAAKNMKSASYPKCLLCKENVGYAGRVNHPARQNLRIIPFNLSNEEWNLQYSPYSYYNEHCIVFSSEHEPMFISKKTFDRNLEFVEKFPHYFIGSNADLPIVGGSILTHDHYQGGRYEFAMAKAKDVFTFDIKGYENIKISMIKWPLSVVRISGDDRRELSELGEKILSHWKNYSDKEVDIHAYTDKTPHNTITPIARKRDNKFELDLVLRNNRTSEEHPDGIFHPHKELHHIKKENIGLIEVLGLAVLPARLKDELANIKECLLDDSKANIVEDDDNLRIHLEWFNEIKSKYNEINKDNIDYIIEDEVGLVFSKVLEHCGVFKWDDDGKKAMEKYMNDLKLYVESLVGEMYEMC
ncbi:MULTISPECIES: UDP-glucose--hexose-1-phosphate uridylyltransferase [unclassified Romboutsia]|uniref:UDP-glucose--hexose-1-phosphate uridylyltransferase n=1 Tax=unclassified Romboutsia TaxID=2626894 RepID=UPI000F04D1B2|nr:MULTISPECIES: UDP-glucose--hexose-1-phosphate uridylyltransferase [unclassified Romboutsia]